VEILPLLTIVIPEELKDLSVIKKPMKSKVPSIISPGDDGYVAVAIPVKVATPVIDSDVSTGCVRVC